MSPLIFVALALAGGAGASARFLVDGLVKAHTHGTLPWGTITINLSGSLVLGLLTGLTLAHVLPPEFQQVLGTGFLGGYTTFSTASFETVRLLQERKWGAGLANALGVLIGSAALAGLGLWLGSLI
ncbi:fluoride efflux transporter CrcB [Brevibacterium sp. 91QC2O2]|jgi:CrcB protein|uniref:fluoride efflux transporter CrcB n=1 Tax=Brevibacterium TaxID=1696 RepID=UPI00211BB18E|nr:MULTISPECIES: fluoride efflux transporter CrcB [unclassified Brevibacterium]MCQ9368449.1 fluoride efflux transporter CrcB [Brevibacterium sp. 91QC2O2]MCQ9385971.1 fluoride efflux transporter CrcB [Brevibacterium sp. 68QC2CO]